MAASQNTPAPPDNAPLFTITFQTYTNQQITPPILTHAAHLFSSAYGIWGKQPNGPTQPGGFPKPGSRIKMSAQKLRREVLPLEAEGKGEREGEGEGKGGNVLVAAWCGEEWVGHVGAVRWEAGRDEEGKEGKMVVWISQLVVKPGFRRRGLATEMIRLAIQIDGIKGGDVVYGILSSHPAALLALQCALHIQTHQSLNINIHTIKSLAPIIMPNSPVRYVREARILPDEGSCCAYTGFFVDRAEPDGVLSEVRRERGEKRWVFGELGRGCEFLCLVEG